MEIIFLCDIDNNDQIQNITYEEICDYSNFSIKITIQNIQLSFDSDVITITKDSIENFINKFENNENCYITFNVGNGSSITFLRNTELIFEVYTYKEGTFTSLSYQIPVNNNNRDQISNVFRQLLQFKIAFDNIEIIDDEDEYNQDQNNIQL
jgi:hypothetical protein